MSFSPPRTYTYADIGLVPRVFSIIRSRDDVETEREFLGMPLRLPVLLAPMETVVDSKVAMAAFDAGMVAVLPRRLTDTEKDFAEFNKASVDHGCMSIPSIPAVSQQFDHIVQTYIDLEAWALCIDVANGYHIAVQEAVEAIIALDKNIPIIAGNIASVEAYEWCWEQGIDAVRVGIGNGSVCTSSLATGCGTGQASLIREIATWKEKNSYQEDSPPLIIADGGIKTPGCIVKAIALGADIVMAGGLFAGTEEAPGSVVVQDSIRYKELAGQASMSVKRSDKYIEGVKTLVPCKGSVKSVAKEIEDGLRSAMAYMNCRTLDELRYLPDNYFAGLSNASKKERSPHANT